MRPHPCTILGNRHHNTGRRRRSHRRRNRSGSLEKEEQSVRPPSLTEPAEQQDANTDTTKSTRPKTIAGASTGGSSTTATPTSTSTKTRTTTTTSASSTSTSFVPQNKTYAASALDATAKGDPIATLAGNVRFVLQNDNNFVVYNTTAGDGAWATLWKTNHTVADCGPVTDCTLAFGADGNLVNYVNGSAVWNAGTAGVGGTLVFMNLEPWVLVLDGEEREVWRSWDGVVEG